MLRKGKTILIVCLGLLAALLLSALASPAQSRERIIGGNVANPADWPFFVSLSEKPLWPYTARKHPYCGGVLVHARWVLTAGHCFVFWRGEDFYGTSERPDLLLETGSSAQGGKVFLHPRFAGKGSAYALPYDAALLRLQKPLGGSVADLAKESPSSGAQASAAGFGLTDIKSGATSTKLLEAENKIISSDRCRSLSPKGAPFFFRSQICTDTDTLSGACFGDSGGPLTFAGKVVGLVSTGDAFCRKGGRADIYTRVSALRPWVMNTLQRGTSRGSINSLRADSYGRGRFRFIMQVNSAVRRARVEFNRRVCVGKKCYRAGRRWSMPRIPDTELSGRLAFFRWSGKVYRMQRARCSKAKVRVRFQNGDLVIRKKRVCK